MNSPGLNFMALSPCLCLIVLLFCFRDGLHLRGRGRIGRGGRLIFDVCSRHASAAATPPAGSHYLDEPDGEAACASGGFGSGLSTGESDVMCAKRKREHLEAVRCAPGPDARKFGPAFIDAVWEEMRASDRCETVAGSGQSRACWNFGTGAKSSYLDP